MSDGDAGKVGGCRCGQVRFRARGPALLTMACHCKGCQRMTASAFSLSEMYNDAAFEILQGQPVRGGMKAEPHHYVCEDCSSWVFTKIASPLGGFVNVRATLFDDADHTPPFIETCTEEKLDWVDVKATHSFPQFPPRDVFPTLIAAYLGQQK